MASASGGVESLGNLSKFTRGLLLVFSGLIGTVMLGIVYIYYRQTSSEYWMMEANQQDLMILGGIGILTLLSLLMMLLIVILFSLWVHRAWSNLHDAGIDSLGTTPGWAVGTYFIPALNLILPLGHMRELANRSAGEDTYQIKATVPDVSAWWTCWVVGVIVWIYLTLERLVDAIPYLHVTTPPLARMGLTAFGNVLIIASAVFLYRVIGTITADQRAMRHVSNAFD